MLTRFELGRSDRAEEGVEIPFVFSTVLSGVFSLPFGGTHHTSCDELRFATQFCVEESAQRLMSKRGQLLRFLMLVEKRVLSMVQLTVPTYLPILIQVRQHRTSWTSQLCKSW